MPSVVAVVYLNQHPQRMMPSELGGGYHEGDTVQFACAFVLDDPKLFFFADSAERVAQEIFDLLNNPDREQEAKTRGWRDRSLSVGDVVVIFQKHVAPIALACESVGWQRIDINTIFGE